MATSELARECPICYDLLEARGRASYRGACGHAFHVDCLNRSVNAGNKSACPLCRENWATDRVVVTMKRAPLRHWARARIHVTPAELENNVRNDEDMSELVKMFFDGISWWEYKAGMWGMICAVLLSLYFYFVFFVKINVDSMKSSQRHDLYMKAMIVLLAVVFQLTSYMTKIDTRNALRSMCFGPQRPPIFEALGAASGWVCALVFGETNLRFIVGGACLIRFFIVMMIWQHAGGVTTSNTVKWTGALAIVALILGTMDEKIIGVTMLILVSACLEIEVQKPHTGIRETFWVSVFYTCMFSVCICVLCTIKATLV